MNAYCKSTGVVLAGLFFLNGPGMVTAMAAPVYKGPLTVKLMGRLSTTGSKKGDPISAQVVSPAEFAGAMVEGQIVESKSSGKLKGTSSINLAFRELTYSGEKYHLSCNVTGFQNSKGQQGVDEEGRAIKRNGKTAGKAILMGAVGAGVGYALGGPTGAAIGGAAGIASVIVVKLSSKAPSIDFDSGSEVFLNGSVSRAAK